MTQSNKTAALAAAFALALSGAAFAQVPVQDPLQDPMQDAIQDPQQNDFATPAIDPAASAEVSFEQLDTDADGYVVKTDVPAEHELAIEFAVADTNSDSRLSRDEFNAYMAPEIEEEAEE